MANKMTAAEIRNNAKAVARDIIENNGLSGEGMVTLGNETFVPVTVDGLNLYVRVTLTTCQWTDTKVTPAFRIEDAIAKYEAEVAEREAKEREKALKKAEKKANSKKVEG